MAHNPLKLKPLDRQVVVITGATSGIGLSTARAAAARGATLMLAARNEEALKSVCDDLAGKGAAVRMMIRVAVPAVLVLAPFWLIPTTLDVHLSMTLPILIPFVYFSHALNKVWRRHMLQVHNMDPDLVDERARKRDAHIHQAYIERYGPRPEAAPPQRPSQNPGD